MYLEYPLNILDEISRVISFSSHIRHFGANALELCYFARGFIDAYIDIRGKIDLQIWQQLI